MSLDRMLLGYEVGQVKTRFSKLVDDLSNLPDLSALANDCGRVAEELEDAGDEAGAVYYAQLAGQLDRLRAVHGELRDLAKEE